MCIQEELEDTKGVIRIRKSKDRQHNDQRKNDKRTNNYLQNTTQKTKDRVYNSNPTKKQVMLIIVDVTVAMKCRTVINVMLLYLRTIVS